MRGIAYVGLDVHKQSISYCVKTAEGRILGEGVLLATRPPLTAWAGALEPPWLEAMEATLFTGWVDDHLWPRAVKGEDVIAFLRSLRRHIRGKVVLVWDNLPVHRGKPEIQA